MEKKSLTQPYTKMKVLDQKHIGLNSALLLFFIFIIVALFGGGLVFITLSNVDSAKVTTSGPRVQQPPDDIRRCTQDADCVSAIQSEGCCSCPEIINRKFLGKEGWEIYDKGKNYGEVTLKECSEVLCLPCLYTDNPPVCKNNKSQSAMESEEDGSSEENRLPDGRIQPTQTPVNINQGKLYNTSDVNIQFFPIEIGVYALSQRRLSGSASGPPKAEASLKTKKMSYRQSLAKANLHSI